MNYSTTDTIAAISSGQHPQAIGIIRLSGPESWTIAQQLVGSDSLFSAQKATQRDLLEADSSLLDQAVILPWKSPHSYTGEDIIELMCHGSPVVLHMVLDRCIKLGARQAEPGEFTLRAFLNGKLSLDQAEAVERLIASKTTASAQSAVRQLNRGLRDRVAAIYEEALSLRTYIASSIDFIEQELELISPAQVIDIITDANSRISELIKQYAAGRVLSQGATVVLAGPPNSGKSTLLNTLSGQNRAIISDIPGTTRDFIDVVLDWGGVPVRLIDTAGLHEATESIETEGVGRARDLMNTADVVIWLKSPPEYQDIPKELDASAVVFPVLSKCDLDEVNELTSDNLLKVSGKTGFGLAELRTEILNHLLSGYDPSDVVVAEQRHHDLLISANSALLRAEKLVSISNLDQAELIDTELTTTLESLNGILGGNHTEELLNSIFSRFCIGK